MLFLLCSFEGPDRYAQAGGLGVRIAELSTALAENGYETHLFFIGDPKKPGEEKLIENRLIYHRWCQWISAYHSLGVYDGEEGKLNDYTRSLPSSLIDNWILPALTAGRNITVMAEEWHTVPMLILLSHKLKEMGIRDKVVLLWNANNVFGFERIHWDILDRECTITTVSRFMKHQMWSLGVNPLVIPNGIPSHWLKPLPQKVLQRFVKLTSGSLTMAKVGRFDPDKRWLMAVDAIALLKKQNLKPLLFFKGGVEPHGMEVKQRANLLGLQIEEAVFPHTASLEESLKALENTVESGADLVEIKAFMSVEFMRLLYRKVDAVLAASGREPFGLVGLEAMGAGGVAVTGATGEDYAAPYQNALVIETDRPEELAHAMKLLKENPDLAKQLRKEGIQTAKKYQWDNVIKILLEKIAFVGYLEGLSIQPPNDTGIFDPQ